MTGLIEHSSTVEDYMDEQRKLLEQAKAKAQQEGKEGFNLKRYVELMYDNSETILKFLDSDPDEVGLIERSYYLQHPEFKTLAAFVNNEKSESNWS